MKKIMLLIMFAVTLSGCAALTSWKTDGLNCLADKSPGGCYEQSLTQAKANQALVTQLAGVAVPIPWAAPVLGGAAGIISFLGLLVINGKKKRKNASV